MRAYIVNRPDEAAMRRLLEKNPLNSTGAILRLAWLQGLLREEITGLTWGQVSFLDRQILLPGRSSPMEEEMEAYLRQMYGKWGRVSEYVVFSRQYGKPMQPQAVSRAARRALDSEGQTAVRLVDLRHDYIIRCLHRYSAAGVAQITGMEVRALQVHFSKYMEQERRPTLRQPRDTAAIDEFKLWKILQEERGSAAGLILWLTWQLGLTGNEIAAATWDQVDFEANLLRLPERSVPLTGAVRKLLLERREDAAPDPHLLLSEHARRPMDLPRISRMARAALIRGGMEQATLRDLYRSSVGGSRETAVLELVRRRGAVSRGEAAEALALSGRAAYGCLRKMTEDGKLVRVGGKYYLPGTVVLPEEQSAVIRRYLESAGFAYRQDIADILHVQSRQCAVILKRLVETGELVQIRQKYYLNLKEA